MEATSNARGDDWPVAFEKKASASPASAQPEFRIGYFSSSIM
jgi:hypothetical protein